MNIKSKPQKCKIDSLFVEEKSFDLVKIVAEPTARFEVDDRLLQRLVVGHFHHSILHGNQITTQFLPHANSLYH